MTMARFRIYVMLLGVKVVNAYRQSCAMRSSPSAGAGAGAGAGDLRGRRRRRRDYTMTMARFTIYVMLLGVKVVNAYRQSCAMRSSPTAGAGAGDLRGRRRRRRRRDYTMTMARFTIYVMVVGVKVVNSYRQSCAMRSSPSAGAGAGDLRGCRRRRRDYITTMARFTIYVMLLGVKVVNSYRQSCAMRSSPSAGAGDLRGRRPARGPGLHHDYGQVHNLCNALRC